MASAVLAKVKEIIVTFWPPAFFASGTFGGIAGTVEVYSFVAGDVHESVMWTLLGLYVLTLISILSYSCVISGRKSLSQRVVLKKRSVIRVFEGEYINSLRTIAARMKREGYPVDGLVCVVGFGQSGNVEDVSEGSAFLEILRQVAFPGGPFGRDCKATRREVIETVNVKKFQDDVEKAIASAGFGERLAGKGRRELPYGTCLLVDLPFVKDENEDKYAKCLLVVNANSRLAHACSVNEKDDIVGPCTSDVIPFVFDRLRDVNVTHLLMPALGTYRLGNSAQSVIASVVSRYLMATQLRQRPFEMVLTLRKNDLERSGIRLVHVKRYIRDSLSLFCV